MAVKCPTCGGVTHRKCLQKYLSNVPEAQCPIPECRAGWGWEWMMTTLTKSFMSGVYWKRRKATVVELERRSLGVATTIIPGTQFTVRMACPDPRCQARLGAGGVCNRCGVNACLQCMEKSHPGKPCNPEVLTSVRMALANSKPCPECGFAIEKVSGCDHMYCTHCRHGFSWSDGSVTSAANPHRAEQARLEIIR